MHNKDNETFIAQYRAALAAKLSRQEFAEYLGILPESVLRRRLSIKTSTGLDLAFLPHEDNYSGVDLDKITVFEEKFKELIEKNAGPKTIKNNDRQGVYVFVAAQNATPVHEGFWATLLQYIECRHGELNVIPYRYKNPTSIYTEHSKELDYWWPCLEPYLLDHKLKLCKGLQILGQIKMQPTATNPLSGFDGFTGEDSAILGHPKVQLRTVATPSKRLPKILATTGACTVPNYTDSKAGHKGRFHHNLSALVVEVDNDKFHIRHIHGEDDGSFYDLDYYYTSTGRTKYGRTAGLVPGDIHAEFLDEKVDQATFRGSDSIMEVLNPEVLVIHDGEDFYRRNHHHKNNDILAYGKHHYGRNNVEEGLQITADFFDRVSRPDTLTLAVRANHDEAFDRWLRDADPKIDPENAKFYYYMKYHQLDNVQRTATGFKTINAFEFWAKNPMDQRGITSETVKFLKRDESFVVGGIEIGFHGDIGNNGGHGSLKSYTKIGPKVVIGHGHSPGIEDGAYQVGVSARLDLEYAVGPSGWLHTHCVIYPNGSRTLLNVINGEWRASFYDREDELLAA
jgi:hypothetical protein